MLMKLVWLFIRVKCYYEPLCHFAMVIKFNLLFNIHLFGPGCNHLKYDFMEKNLKIRDFFGKNFQSIFSYHEENIFRKIRPQSPF